MVPKLVVVVGATGGQGSSVITSFLKDGTGEYIRGLTRNPESERAKALSTKGVEMVKGDLGDLASLERAFSGANVIFAITDYYENFWTEGWQRSMDIEYIVYTRHQYGQGGFGGSHARALPVEYSSS